MNELLEPLITQRDDLTFYRTAYWPPSFQEWPIYPFCYEESVRDDAVRFYDKRCPYIIIIFIVDGEMVYLDGDKREYFLKSGNLLVVPQFADYAFLSSPRRHYHKLVLEIKGNLLSQYAETLGLNEFRLLSPEAAAPVIPILRRLGEMLQNCGEETVPELIGETIRLLTLTAQRIRDSNDNNRIIMSARAWLERNLSSEFTVALLAEKLGISHAQLDWMFRTQLGMSPQRYRIAYKMRQAEYLLTNTPHAIKDIALRLGYANQLYFSNDFKKHSGQSPKHYRRKHASGETSSMTYV